MSDELSDVLKRIRSRGYWRTLVHPTTFGKDRIPDLSTCRRIARESQVTMRTWTFPFIGRQEPAAKLDSIEHTLESDSRKEFWRLYQSAQFVHFLAMREDWREIDPALLKWQGVSVGVPILDAFWALHGITQRYEFAARFIQRVGLTEGVVVEVGLHRMRGRRLVSLDPRRDLFEEYVCNEENLERHLEISSDRLLGQTRELALDHAIWVFERFNWDNPPRHVLADAQREIIELA